MRTASGNGVALIGSGHVNAIGIALSLRELGWEGRIICAAPRNSLSELYPDLCETVHHKWTDTAELVEFVARYAASDVPVQLFLTDEILLDSIDAHRETLEAAHVSWYPRIECDWQTVTDRKCFYQFVVSRGLAEIAPYAEPGCNPWKLFPNGCRARVWKSWERGRKLPRGMNILNGVDLDLWLATAEAEGLNAGSWSFQKLLSCDPRDNVSVCGWHDPDFQFYATTRKLIQSSENGRMVESVPANELLCAAAKRILNALGFAGPFEMEFLLDPDDKRFKVIELNPRYWMQHRLLGALAGNVLIRRHLKLEIEEQTRPCLEGGLWIDAATLGSWMALRPLLQMVKRRRQLVSSVPIARLVRHETHRLIARFARKGWSQSRRIVKHLVATR